MFKTLILSIVCTAIVGNMSVLNLFQTDYDSDKYEVTQVEHDVPDNVPEGWLPLRAVSFYLPIEVDWDNATREIIVVSEAMRKIRPLLAERRYKADALPDNLVIDNGTTYCSPRFLSNALPGISFEYNGLYVFDGECAESFLVQPNGSSVFKPYVLTALYRLKLVMPEMYEMVRTHLSGGIAYDPDRGDLPPAAVAYVYVNRRHPTCYILDDRYYGAQLAAYIGHEAYHVYQHNTTGTPSERDADVVEKKILSTLVSQ